MYNSDVRVAHKRTLEALSQLQGFNQMAFVKLTADTSPATALEILGHFRDTIQKARQDYEKANEQKSAELVSKVCHKLRGSSELLGFTGFSKTISQIQTEMKNHLGDPMIFESCVDEMILNCDSLAAYIDVNCSSPQVAVAKAGSQA